MNDARILAVEEENNALRSRLRRQDGLLSRIHLHHDHDKDAHLVPALRQRVKDLESTNLRTESELAETSRLLRAFQQETYALRTLIKFSDYPDKADAARAEGERLAALEDAKRLRGRLVDTQNDYAACQQRCDEALATVAEYRSLLENAGAGTRRRQHAGETGIDIDHGRPKQRHSHGSIGTDSLPDCGVGVNHRSPSPHLSQHHDADEDEDDEDDDTQAGTEDEPHGPKVQSRPHRVASDWDSRKLSSSQAVIMQDMAQQGSERLSHGTLTVSDVSDADAEEEKMRKALAILHGENALLTRRIGNVVAQNKHFIATIAELEMRCAELANRVGSSP